VPYRADLARRNVLPAMVASAAAYVTFAAIDGTDPILPVAGGSPFDWRDLGGALAVGLLCGLGARLFSAAVRSARGRRIADVPVGLRILAAGVALALFAYVAEAAADAPLTLGPGYDVIRWATDPSLAQWLVLTLLVLRVGAVLATLGGGGAGGLVIPLVVMGALTGRFASGALGMADSDLLLVVGMAAFLGAGYRTPLAAIMFVAETTGHPGFVVPALVATAGSQLLLADSSVSGHQRAGRLGHLERRFELPISAVLETDVRTVPPDATIEEFLTVHLVGYRQRAVPVVDDANRYLGLVALDEVVTIRREAWATTEIRTIANVAAPRGRTTWLVRDAVQAMEGGDADVLAVVDGDDRFVGVVTTDEVLRLDEILERTNGAR
jgi:CIC family chloride channel protein